MSVDKSAILLVAIVRRTDARAGSNTQEMPFREEHPRTQPIHSGVPPHSGLFLSASHIWGASPLYDAWKRSGSAVFTGRNTNLLIDTAEGHQDDTAFQYTVGQTLASRKEYVEGAKLHVRYMKDARYDGAVAELEAMKEDIQKELNISVNLKQLAETDPEQAASLVAQVWRQEDEAE